MAPMNLQRNRLERHRQRSDLAEPVVEIFHVNKESQVNEEPEDEGLSRRNVKRYFLLSPSDLEEESDDDRVVDPIKFDVELEGAPCHGQIGLCSELSHFECCQSFIS